MINDAIADDLESLRSLYRDLTGYSAPRNLRAALLQKLIDWHCRCIENATPHREAFFYRAQAIQEIKLPVRRQHLASGDIIIREHNGKNHIVRRRPDGKFTYLKRTYSSLTAIAKTITGVHQSGPKFFGLTKNGGSAQ